MPQIGHKGFNGQTQMLRRLIDLDITYTTHTHQKNQLINENGPYFSIKNIDLKQVNTKE